MAQLLGAMLCARRVRHLERVLAAYTWYFKASVIETPVLEGLHHAYRRAA
jgi:hypothetical protein